MTIHIGSDHAGVEMKAHLINYLGNKGFDLKDHGPENNNSVDYPDFGHAVATAVENDPKSLGIVLCGSGNGINITVNKHQNIRSGLAWLPEIAALARQHNNVNILALPARFVDIAMAEQIVDAYLNAEFEGGRHQRRVDKISL